MEIPAYFSKSLPFRDPVTGATSGVTQTAGHTQVLILDASVFISLPENVQRVAAGHVKQDSQT